MGGRPTIKDVARDAGVSTSTVSNWLAGKEYGLSAETRERVASSAKRLGYRPSRLAQAMRGQSIRTIGLIISTITSPAMPPLVRGAEDRAVEAGHFLFLSNIDRNWSRVAEHSLAMTDRGVSGIAYAFVITSPDDPVIMAARDAGVSTAILIPASTVRPPPPLTIAVDNEAGMRQIVRHLHSFGHRDVGFASTSWVTANGPHREDGLRSALEEKGLSLQPRFVHVDPVEQSRFDEDDEIASGRRSGLHLLSQSERPSAICCVTDLVAVGVIMAARDLNIRVPEELSVTGFDDFTLGRIVTPTLTTVSTPLYSMGRQLVSSLVAPSDGPGTLITPSLIVRESTGPA